MAERLRPYITETSLLLNNMIDEGKDLLFEGAQATLLDIDHGTYPYVRLPTAPPAAPSPAPALV